MSRFRVPVALLYAAMLSLAAEAPAADPCCRITAIDPSTGLVTAREKTIGRVFQFKPTNPQALGSLSVGQEVYANYGRRLASLDGTSACCRIVTIQSLAETTQPHESAATTARHAAGVAAGVAPQVGAGGNRQAASATSSGQSAAKDEKAKPSSKQPSVGDEVKAKLKKKFGVKLP